MARSVYARFGTSNLTGTASVQRQHNVIAGDTIPKIAAFYEPQLGYSSEYWRQIAEANNIDDLNALTVGQTLVIPTPKSSTT